MSTNDYVLLEEIRDIFRYRHAQDDGLRLLPVDMPGEEDPYYKVFKIRVGEGVPEDPYDSDELPSE